jgi:hypothetical protein
LILWQNSFSSKKIDRKNGKNSMLSFILSLWCLCCSFTAIESTVKLQYDLKVATLDVVIPCVEKDLETLNACIAGIRDNCSQIRRVIVVSARPLTDQAEWCDEARYPFTKEDVAFYLLKGDQSAAASFLQSPSHVGWYYQQLLKYYATFVIPDLSSNVLILDSDTIFLNPVQFLDANCEGLYNPGSEYHRPYFEHASRFLPGLQRLYPHYSGISHHMLFQRSVLEDLFYSVENYHDRPLWQAFCLAVSLQDLSGSGASEYELYFNFVFSRTDQVHIRQLKWKNVSSLNDLASFKSQGYHYVSCHAWLRASHR